MAINNILVVAESADGKVATSTLELLTAAKATGATVSAIVAGDGSAEAAELGAFGASKVYATGDLGGALLGVPVASAIAGMVLPYPTLGEAGKRAAITYYAGVAAKPLTAAISPVVCRSSSIRPC